MEDDEPYRTLPAATVRRNASTTTAGSTSTYAYNFNGNRTSVVVPPTPDTTAPSVPSNPAASATAWNLVTVSWTASSDDRGVTGYLVYRGGTLVGLTSGTSTSFIDRTTAPSTAYSYTVAAIDAAGNLSSQSSAAGVTTPTGTPGTDTTPPSTPTGLSGTPVAGSRIDLSWTASTDNVGVAGYNVYRDGVKINTAPVGSIAYSDTGLVAGANHTYTVSAIDAAANESPRSGSWSGAAGSGAITTTYSYDPENRLTQLATGSGVIGSYSYDGAGNRIGKTAGGVTTNYTLDLASTLPQVLSETAGSSTTSYAYAGGPLELDKGGTTYWYLDDTLGSVRLVTDSTGASPATYAYSAFGSTRKSTGTLANEVRFTGERTDGESGLEFLRARTYDPSVGTFLQRDSWGISPTSSQSIDAYAYTANNPVNAVDPSGHCGTYDPAGDCGGSGTSSTSSGGGGIGGRVSDEWSGYDKVSSSPTTPFRLPPNVMADQKQCAADPTRATQSCVNLEKGGWTPREQREGLPMPAVVVGGSAALCALAWETVVACLPFAGVAVYTGANVANNGIDDVFRGGTKGPLDGWNWQDAATGGLATTLAGLAPVGVPAAMGLGGVLGFGSDVVDQQMQHAGTMNWNHAFCSGAAGAFAGAAVFSGTKLTKFVKAQAWGLASSVGGTQFCSGQ